MSLVDTENIQAIDGSTYCCANVLPTSDNHLQPLLTTERKKEMAFEGAGEMRASLH